MLEWFRKKIYMVKFADDGRSATACTTVYGIQQYYNLIREGWEKVNPKTYNRIKRQMEKSASAARN